ncbi:MAG: GWxTD domain-containing protein [Bacteroidales bacterium]
MKSHTIKEPVSLIIVLLGILLLTSCVTTQPAFDPKDLSYLYNPLKTRINPRYGVFNESENRSFLSVKFFSGDLFFTEANPAGVPMARMFILVRVYNMSFGRAVVDTAYYDLDIIKEPAKEEYLYRIPLHVQKGMEYVCEIKIYDKIRDFMIQAFVTFNTLSEFNSYNFYARGHLLKNDLLKPVVRKDEYFNIIYGRGHPDSIFISVFRLAEDIPYPPSMVLPERPPASKPDTVVAIAYADTLPLMLPNTGIYFITVSREIKEGYTMFNFGNDFPSMTTPEEMIKPIAYLLPEDDLKIMASHEKPKVALDEFWLNCGGGNVEKARELIRIFYTRAVFANYYFTSWKEGWRTDRGMIYIIYGPPDKLYKSADVETWGYRNPVVRTGWGSRFSVKEEYLFFTFKKKENPFTDNDYSLSRSETVVSYWDKAVQSWRKGIVFRLDNPEGI